LHVAGNVGATVFVSTSDARFKRDAVSVPSSTLSSIIALQPYSYYWNDLGIAQGGKADRKEFGFMAQDVEQIFPELVYTREDGYKGVNYTGFTALTISAIKELNTKFDMLASSTASTSLASLGNNVMDDINMNGFAINNIKSLSSNNNSWSIDNNGRITATELCLTDAQGTVCMNAGNIRNMSGTIVPAVPPVPPVVATATNATITVTGGDATISSTSTTPYTDQGAIVTITYSDGTTSTAAATATGTVNATTAGTYTITYSYVNPAYTGAPATASREVTVS
jgi:hypothetical protein